MDEIIKQLTRIIENKDKFDEKKAQAYALKEVILSGLSRSGFFRDCPYLSNMDLYNQNELCLTFLCQSNDFSFRNYDQILKYEMEAAGIDFSLLEDTDRLNIKCGGTNLVIFVYKKDLSLKSSFTYQQQPLPYELRTITSMTEGIRAEIEKARDLQISSDKTSDVRKKSKSKPHKEKIKKEDTQWVQPSLFDF